MYRNQIKTVENSMGKSQLLMTQFSHTPALLWFYIIKIKTHKNVDKWQKALIELKNKNTE